MPNQHRSPPTHNKGIQTEIQNNTIKHNQRNFQSNQHDNFLFCYCSFFLRLLIWPELTYTIISYLGGPATNAIFFTLLLL